MSIIKKWLIINVTNNTTQLAGYCASAPDSLLVSQVMTIHGLAHIPAVSAQEYRNPPYWKDSQEQSCECLHACRERHKQLAWMQPFLKKLRREDVIDGSPEHCQFNRSTPVQCVKSQMRRKGSISTPWIALSKLQWARGGETSFRGLTPPPPWYRCASWASLDIRTNERRNQRCPCTCKVLLVVTCLYI